MSCYHPLPAVQSRVNAEGKTLLRFGAFTPRNSNSRVLSIPCGQCVGCRLERSRQWAVRCMHEASLYEDNSFLTLTYDKEHLPLDGSLVLSHMQDFFKRLRRRYEGKKIRYYHCGEYGESLGRPHYHALLFNHGFKDKRLFSNRYGNNRIYTSDELSSLWTQGFSVIGDVTFESAAYVARYVMKKVTGKKADSHYAGRRPEYTTMSRRPGIGKGWYDKFKGDVFPLDRLVVNGKETRPPRYYQDLLAKEDRSLAEFLKLERESKPRKFVNDVVDGKNILVRDDFIPRLLVKEEVKMAEISTLRRPYETEDV